MKNFDNIKDLIKYLNSYRLENKNSWFNDTVTFKGVPFGIKFFDTWTQVMSYRGFRYSGSHDLTVTQWKKEIENFLNNEGA
jgi:hypothetical protein